MSKAKIFMENMVVYGVGGIISKIIPLLMLPIITRIMPSTEYFGIVDLSNTLVSFASAFALFGMYDGMYRMFFEKNEMEYKKRVCSTTLIFTITVSSIVFVLMIIFKDIIAHYFFGNSQYGYVVYLSALAVLVGSTNLIVAAPTRMQNKRKIFLAANTALPIISYTIAILWLITGHYIIALPLSTVISGLFIELYYAYINRKWFDFKLFDVKILKQTLALAVPLVPNFLIYWLFNSSDKLMITNILSVGDAGIYSVGSKLGHCSQLIYTAFAGGWGYFTFSTMKEKNQVESNSKLFECLGIFSFIFTMFVCACSNLIFTLLFEEQYLPGFIIAPYLFLAPLLQMLFQVAISQFMIIKKTWPNMLILMVGAFINIVLNIILIPLIGIEGASIATLLGYAVSDLICVVVLIKHKLMIISKKFCFSIVILIIYIFIWRFIILYNTMLLFLTAMVSTFEILFLYKNELKSVLNKMHRT